MNKKIHPALLKIIRKVKGKRPKTVIDHILKHGFITTEELERDYGYNHPPRAARDVREAGIPLETFKVKGTHGRIIAAYRFGDLRKIEDNKLNGRKIFPKELKKKLYKRSDGKCEICSCKYEERYLQIDHRIPYEIKGDKTSKSYSPRNFLLICASCQRSKSWTCEHCLNWTNKKSISLCRTCYWGEPDSYTHIALEQARRLDLVWIGEEIINFELLTKIASEKSIKIQKLIKTILEKSLKGTKKRVLKNSRH